MAMRPLLSMITDVTETVNGYPTPSQSPTQDQVTCWLVDTRKLWPGDKLVTAPGASRALELISPAERQAIVTKVFAQDARMSLASALLKRLYICKTLGIEWEDVRLGRKKDPKNGKPCAVDSYGRPIDGIDFNVSHQGGLVALVGYDGRVNHEFSPSGMVYGLISPTSRNERLNVGVDIVCVNERDDYRTIDSEGMDGWVDVYDFVFSAEERWSMKYDVDYITMLDGTHLKRDEIGRHDRCINRHKTIALTTPAGRSCQFSSERIIEAKLRRFYTYFCYKEAYIKVSGEALLAPWLRQLEFFNVRSPKPGTPQRCSSHGVWGETVEDVEVQLHKRSVSDVKMKIQAFEEDFMISTAIQGDITGVKVPGFNMLDLVSEIRKCTGEETGHDAYLPRNTMTNTNNSRPASNLHIDLPKKRFSVEQKSSPSQQQQRITSPSMTTPTRKMQQLGFSHHHTKSPGSPGTPRDNPYAHMNDVPLCLM